MNDHQKRTISFADFELDTSKRRLSRDGTPLAINAKAFDLLVFLTENAGRVVSKDEILNAVWENQFVEEANLAVQISALRKALGEQKGAPHFLVTIPGKGYEFIADVRTGNEIVIENHRVSHVIVTETDVGYTDDPIAAGRAGPFSRPFTPARVITAVGVLVVLAIVSIWVYKVRSDRDQAVSQSTPVKAAQQFATSIFTVGGGGMPERVAISPDGKTLAYVARTRRQYSLWLGEIEKSHSVQIIPPTDRSFYCIVFAPDGKSIYFTSRDVNHRQPTLMRVSVFGGAIQDLISDVDSIVTFSPDGRSVAFLRRKAASDQTSLMIADAETGQNEKELTSRQGPDNFIMGGLSWSPDGQRIAFAAANGPEGGTSLYSIDVAGKSVTNIGGSFPNRIVNLVWRADGKGLFANRNTSNDAGDGKIWFVPFPSGEPAQITADTLDYHIFSLSVSVDNKVAVMQTRNDPLIRIAPKGELQNSQTILEGTKFRSEGRYGIAIAPDGKILFSANANGSRTIWEMDANGDHQQQLTASQDNCYDQQLGITADDRFLVFESNRSGQQEIWRSNRDGSDLRALTNGGGNIQPAISADGTWVFYISERNGQYGLWRISINGGEPEQLTTEKSFWPAASPDGKSIAFVHDRSEIAVDRVISVIPTDGDLSHSQTLNTPISAALYNRFRWSPDGKALVYKDESQGLWYHSLTSTKPESIESPEDLRIFQFAYSPDGKIVYSGGIQSREIVILAEKPQ